VASLAYPIVVLWLAVVLVIAVLAVVLNSLAARRGGYPTGGSVVVRCRKGHLFTTIWVTGVSFKAIRLGSSRVQRCPLCEHWTRVVRVRDSDLTNEERQIAAAHHDTRIP
jgi:hypothetical protein